MIVFHLTWLLHFVHDVTSYRFRHQYSYSLSMGHKFVASISDIPFHVLVVYGNLYCSGSLVRSKIVITTATCMTAGPKDRTFVKVGSSSITGLGQVIQVLDIKMHEYFRYYSGIDNDIAMLLLKDNVIFSHNVKKVLLTDPEHDLEPSIVIDVSGWGSQSLPQKYAYMLLSTQMVLMERDDCIETYKSLITPSNFCAKYQADHRLSDIGGPAIYKQRLIGIVSYGASNEQGPHVAILTNITYFNKWIMLNTKRFLEKHCVSDKDLFHNTTMKSSSEELSGQIQVGLVHRGIRTMTKQKTFNKL